MPILEAMNISDTHTWVASPTKASLQSSMDLPSGKFSIMVMRSPSSWVGWLYSLMPLITGAAEYLARSTTSLWRSTRAMRMSTSDPMTRPESSMDSWPPSWMEPGPKNWAWPPRSVMAVSKEMRVRVDTCWKIMPSVLFFRSSGYSPPSLMSPFMAMARSTMPSSSSLVKSLVSM